MFGIGASELAVIALVAAVLFGPERLPELAKQAGQMVRHARQVTDRMRSELQTEAGGEWAGLELRDLDPRAIVRRPIAEAMADESDATQPDLPRAVSATTLSSRSDADRPSAREFAQTDLPVAREELPLKGGADASS